MPLVYLDISRLPEAEPSNGDRVMEEFLALLTIELVRLLVETFLRGVVQLRPA
jgi:hypothetical protein